MADDANTTEVAHWNSAKFNHTVAHRAWSIVDLEDDCPARQQVALTLNDARTKLFSVSAPDIGAVIEKLNIWWGEGLFDETYVGLINRRVIGDLWRIQMKAVGSDDMEASGRSPEEAAADAEAWRSALGEYLDLEKEFFAGLVPGGEDESSETLSALYYAQGELLQMSAPSLGGVIKKLEIIWEDSRFEETVEDGSIYVHLMRDLNRLVSAQKAQASTLQ